jgi:hypothetical protein
MNDSFGTQITTARRTATPTTPRTISAIVLYSGLARRALRFSLVISP